jgi:hypothetical protein
LIFAIGERITAAVVTELKVKNHHFGIADSSRGRLTDARDNNVKNHNHETTTTT